MTVVIFSLCIVVELVRVLFRHHLTVRHAYDLWSAVSRAPLTPRDRRTDQQFAHPIPSINGPCLSAQRHSVLTALLAV
uniref:Secreted protein n=1 Tax=Caenorhabditis japonica TaxID=281687 RepID=A0A8R1ESB5_CAEJA